jgi:hypothetical protein
LRKCSCKCASLTPTAGSRPPLLRMRARVSQKSVTLPADGRCNSVRSGGRKPPVGNKTPLQIATAYLRRYAPAVAVLSGAWPGVANCNRFSATTCVRATRSGWRKPAVVSGNALAAASSHLSRRGHPRAVCTRTPLQLRYQTHGGLTPAALVPASRGHRTVPGFRGTALGSRNHGGLTPAALVNVRSCIAKILFSPTNTRTAT